MRKMKNLIALFIVLLFLSSVFAQVPRRTTRPVSRSSRYRRTVSGKKSMKNLKQVWSKDFLKGYKISATFNRTDLRSVLRVFYSKTKLNFIINKEVRGTITGRFNDVPALEALITVLRVNDLYFIEEGSIIRIVSPEAYSRDIIKKNAISKVFNINHANIKNLENVLKSVLTEGVGTAVFDVKANKIHITDLKSNFKKIKSVISNFSQPAKQVYIDVKLVSVDLKTEKERGVNWQALNIGNYFNFSSIFDASADKYGEFAFATGTSSAGSADGLIRALNSTHDTKLLTSPKVVAAHGQEAKIKIGDNIPYVSKVVKTETSTESTVSFLNAGIKLDVTPYIGNDGTIRLDLEVEISSAKMINITDDQQAPQKTETTTKTRILCDNGALVVIGGLFEYKTEIQEKRVPLLGYIPILKYLFSWKNKVTEKREIVIMIRPTIIGSKQSALSTGIKKMLDKDKAR